MKKGEKEKQLPAQQQTLPGEQQKIRPQPSTNNQAYKGSDKLRDKVAIITGGDSGIGQAVAVCFAKEGADLVIVYLNEHEDAKQTQKLVEKYNRRCLLLSGDIGKEDFCEEIVEKTIETFGQLDILVNNAAEQHPQENLQDITAEQLEKTFKTNIFSMFYLTKAALKYLKEGSAIINTTSVTAYRGQKILVDYSATKGAIVAFTRSLALNLADKKIRVNAVAPGPIWTPLIPSTFPAGKVETFGSDTPLKRAAQPDEVAPCYVFLASNCDSSYITGQVMHPNGGEIINA